MTVIQRLEAAGEPEDEPDLRLTAERERVYPMAVHGMVRRFKWAVLCGCLLVYYLLPWLRWDRGPGRPSQAFLLDIWNERMYILGWELWPQEIYFLAGALILGAFALFMVTSLVGRVWCGYACPQTVWTDLFLWIERLIEGDRNARMRRDRQPMSWAKLWRKIVKHWIWIGIAFWTGGAWIMYYADAPTVTRQFWTGTASTHVYFFTGLFTATTYLLAGWAREQVCTFMCPWPRFQSAMLDEQTITVTYQAWRGEPRGKKAQGQSWADRGDCVDCKACLHACPTGIDIRDGQQLECINCGLCIDACNTVMEKLERPQWLINWDNLGRQNARAKHLPIPAIRFLRARTMIYAGALAVGLAVLLVAATQRSQLGISVQRDRAPLFVRLENGSIRNGYTLSMLNKLPRPRRLELTVTGLPGGELRLPERADDVGGSSVTLPAEGDTVTDVRVLVHAAAGVRGDIPIDFVLRDPATGETAEYHSVFLEPSQER